ncbi:MAG TPA: UDP-N-acetylglucosamine--N-acetylmuramyl-(pentapeptide) pyrophosphoryl-undecaprenol N-acetylglucosamine transferase [Dehalococcoidia bacterium]|nr:UDP-N-acetylglucosamine--N-acetylmuramyl-(pentapeptide) pyrophosphoryl-undecaprenol N-acetylglucosamine transferase [Dehalococcoidia bacterium]
MRLALSGGGTGGHVYPALSIAEAVERELPSGETLDVLYIGSSGGAESDLVRHAGLALRSITAAPIRGRMPWEMAANAGKIAIGARQARGLLSEFRPQVVLSTGGYAGFPVALAARSRGVPIAVYLPDLYPGWAVRAIARLAQKVTVTAIESLRRLPAAKTLVTGYPVRDEFWHVNRTGGRERLGLDPEEKVLFVTGASSGAHSINKAVAGDLPGLLELCEVIHLCGHADESWLTQIRDRLPKGLKSRYHLYGYMYDETPWAMAAADLALCRSGASTMGELPAVALPAVLVPYPYAGGHQKLNARYLEKNGAATILDDADLDQMLPVVGGLLHDEARLRAMREAAHRLARPDAARRIARILFDLADGASR